MKNDSEGLINCVDITGGAPEMNPNFEWFLRECASLGRSVKVRTNLSVLLLEEYRGIPKLFKKLEVELVASLPCYTELTTDAQRGEGVFQSSIEVMLMLNDMGYAKKDSGLILGLVYNPTGASLPPSQSMLKEAYRERLLKEHMIEFNDLYAMINMPIGRFAESLRDDGTYLDYMSLLEDSFNSDNVEALMCRNLISVGFDGALYGCDFNLALGLPLMDRALGSICDIDVNIHKGLLSRLINIGDHCYGCTAGAGSSCVGSLAYD
jgi:radical SAM/Cys-rich protein